MASGAHNTRCTAGREREYGALRLLTLAVLRLPDVALYAHLLHAHGGDAVNGDGVLDAVARALRDTAAGALRLGHRALETHGDDIGYRIDAWLRRAQGRAAWELDEGSRARADGGLPVALEQARLATIALTRATAATAADRMVVPDQLSVGLGHLLVVYLIAAHTVAA